MTVQFSDLLDCDFCRGCEVPAFGLSRNRVARRKDMISVYNNVLLVDNE